MKKLIVLTVLITATSVFAWSRATRSLEGDVSWHKGKWTCSVTNSLGRTIETTGFRFEGDTRRGGSGSFYAKKSTMLNNGEKLEITKYAAGAVDYVRNCFLIYIK